MKKNILSNLILLLMLGGAVVTTSCNDSDDSSVIPINNKSNFIEDHYPGVKISKTLEETDANETVILKRHILENDIEVTVDASDDWIKVESTKDGVFIDKKIIETEAPNVMKNMPEIDAKISSFGKLGKADDLTRDDTSDGYFVQVVGDSEENVSELIFNRNGDFVKNNNQNITNNTKNYIQIAENFVAQHFPNDRIYKRKHSYYKYKIELYSGVELEFDYNGNWTEIESANDKTALPNSVLPTGIVQYMLKFPNVVVSEISKKNNQYKLDVYNKGTFRDFHVYFNLNGGFIYSEGDLKNPENGNGSGNTGNGNIIPGLPTPANNFINQYFSGLIVTKFKQSNYKFEVKLSGKYELEFDYSGKWTQIESERSNIALPLGIVPKIETFATSLQGGKWIINEIEITNGVYKVEFYNTWTGKDRDAKFTSNQDFIKWD